jgi:sensor histidine kinase YesM
MKGGMRRNLTILFIALFLIVIFIWILFYNVVSRYIHADAENQVELTANRIMTDLGHEFENLERVVFSLSRYNSVVDFTVEKDRVSYFHLAEQISKLLSGSRYNPDFVNHVVIFNEDSAAYRFSGALSNQASTKVQRMIDRDALPEHLVMASDGINYIGYADGVYNEAGQCTGLIVMLIEEEKILALIDNIVPEQSLLVSVIANGETITANTQAFLQTMVRPTSRHIGVTSFEILVSANEQSLRASTRYFTIAAVITALMFGALILLFARILNKRFFSPMLRVIKGVEELDENMEGHQLSLIQSEEFDGLIGKVNEMLGRLERRGKAVQVAELRALNADLEKQKAIVFSLKKQINTHFLINTLNQVLNRVGSGDAENAITMLKDLSSVVQYVFNEDDYVLVWDKFQILDNYLTILNIRYEHRITWDMDIDDSLMDEAMPRMLLQPIVENAAFHGLKNRKDIYITIKMQRTPEHNMLITICDNGQGMTKEKLEDLRAKLEATPENAPDSAQNIALANVKRRLHSYFWDHSKMTIDSTAGAGTEVMLLLPQKM